MTRTIQLTFREALRHVLADELASDPRVILLGENLHVGGPFKVTQGLADRFGKKRVIETPVVENAIVGGALGLAIAGKVAVAEIFNSDFLFTAGNEVINDIPKWRFQHGRKAPLHLVIRGATGAAGGQGPEHSQCIEAYLLHVPGLQVAMPGTPADAAGLLRAVLRSGKPTVFLEHKRLYDMKGAVPLASDFTVPIGKAEIVRPGSDLTIVAWAWMRHEALHAADMLAEHGFNAEVVDLRTISPLDVDTVAASARRTGRLLVVEESYRTGGVAAEIIASVVERVDSLGGATARVAMLDAPIPYADRLERELTPDRRTIAESALALLRARRGMDTAVAG